jgi:hypothetical protein
MRASIALLLWTCGWKQRTEKSRSTVSSKLWCDDAHSVMEIMEENHVVSLEPAGQWASPGWEGRSFVRCPANSTDGKRQLRLFSSRSLSLSGKNSTSSSGLACSMTLLRNILVLFAFCGAATLDIPSHGCQQPASSSKICRSWSMGRDAGLCSRNSESLNDRMGTMRLRGGGAKQLYHLTVIHPLPTGMCAGLWRNSDQQYARAFHVYPS